MRSGRGRRTEGLWKGEQKTAFLAKCKSALQQQIKFLKLFFPHTESNIFEETRSSFEISFAVSSPRRRKHILSSSLAEFSQRNRFDQARRALNVIHLNICIHRLDRKDKSNTLSEHNGRSDHVWRIGCRYSNGSKEGKKERERKRKQARRKKSMMRLSYREWNGLLCSAIECVHTERRRRRR